MRVLLEPATHAGLGKAKGSYGTWEAPAVRDPEAPWPPPAQLAALAQVDACICLGGDGTIIWASKLFRDGMPPVLSFAMGSLGFLTPFPLEEYPHALTQLLRGDFHVTLRMRLECVIVRAGADPGGPPPVPIPCLNEVVVDRGPGPSLVDLDCWCDGMRMTKLQADGLIISTPTGSTAYNLAAGGSMVHPGISAMLFTPICPHALTSRPLLLPDGVELRIQAPSLQNP